MTPPTQIAHYRITGKLGEGGMGAVYRATDTKLNREVAIKVLPAAFAEDSGRMARFEREAQVLASLNHANIAAIYGIEERAIVMELVEGEELRGPLPVEKVRDYALQIIDALEAAHEKGITHRDLKPANVKITPEGVVKVLDFGLAKPPAERATAGDPALSPTLTMSATQAGVILGTAGYMAPEQARGEVVDRRADIFAFGVVLYEMLTGQHAFSGKTVADILASVIRAEPDLSALPRETPAALRKLIARCLVKERKQRLSWIGEARHILAEPPEVPSKAPANWLPWAAAAVTLFGGMAVERFRGPQPAEPPVRKFSIGVQSFPVRYYARHISISPNGRQVAYIDGGRLWVRDLDKEAARVLEGTDGALGPFWSPDSEFIGFATDRDVKKVAARGGAVVTLCPAASFRGGDWNPDGKSIVFSEGRLGALEVPAAGGAARLVFQSARALYSPRFLPREAGKRTLLAGEGDLTDQRLLVVNLETGQQVPLVAGAQPVYSPTGHVLYQTGPGSGGLWALPFSLQSLKSTGEAFPIAADAAQPDLSDDGTLIWRDMRGLTARQLVWRDRAGRRLGTIGQPQPLFLPALSPDGSRVAVASADGGNRDIWIHEVARPLKSRLTLETSQEVFPIWSPDGKGIAYRTDRNGNHAIFLHPADGSGEAKPLLAASRYGTPSDWSPDGKYLVYSASDPATGIDIWYLRRKADGSGYDSVPFLKTPFSETVGRISPDGRFLAYESNESGEAEVYVRPFPEGTGKWQVSVNGGLSPRWSKDGKELYYVTGESLMAVRVKTAAGFSTEGAAPLFRNSGLSQFNPFDVSRDGRFVLSEPVEGEDAKPRSIHVVENWFAEFKKKAKP